MSLSDIKTGAPNNGFVLNALTTLFRISRVLLDLWKRISSRAKNFYLFVHPRAAWVFSKLQGLQHYFSEHFSCNLEFYQSENWSVHRIFGSKNFRFNFPFSSKTRLNLGSEIHKIVDNLLDKRNGHLKNSGQFLLLRTDFTHFVFSLWIIMSFLTLF